jgi:uncharacterized hydrophobic protein (TIGR00271 family)
MATESKAIASRATLRANIDLNSTFDVAYVTMNILAAVVCVYGLFENSPAVVIGAMIIAMLLGPIAGVSLGLADRNNLLLRKALVTLAGGFALVYGTAFLLGAMQTQFPLTNEILSRTTPNLMDLMIALGGGAAGAYSMISPRLNVAFVGVAIATALVPPLSASAICLARGEYSLASGALLLAFANIVGIQVAGSIVMWLSGYRGSPQHHFGSGLKRNFLSVAALCTLAVVLGIELREVISKEVYEVSVRKILNTAASTHEGAYLVEARFQREAGHLFVVADYRTPVPFTPEEVAALQPRLPLMRGANSLDLRIRSIPVIVASKAGYLFSSEDLSDYVRQQ